MAFILKPFQIIRNNWKKSVFFTGLAAYGYKYANEKYEESLLRKAYCLEAKRYGDVPLRTGDSARRITVFLNPAAKNGKGKKLFDKNVAPILHLAGFEVRVVKTEYEGQAKKYMEVIEDTDAIVVAGGDGTLLEVITGLLRRPDADKYAKVPIGFVPLGFSNTVAQSFTFQGTSDVQWQAEAAMAVVKGLTKPKDVIHIKGEENKNVYALSKLEYGMMTDVQKRIDKVWYLGPLKERWAYMRETWWKWPPTIKGHVTYSPPCEGCSKCFVKPPDTPWKWWHIFIPPRKIEFKDYSEVENNECGLEYAEPVSTLQLDLEPTRDSNGQAALSVSLGPTELAKTEFIQKGWKGETETFVSKEILGGRISFQPEIQEGKEEFFMIDNEKFEMMPIEVTLLKDKINMFCSQPDRPFVTLETNVQS